MENLIVKSVKCDTLGGGPLASTVVAEAEFEDENGEPRYISIMDCVGIVIYIFDKKESMFETLMNENLSEQENDEIERSATFVGEYNECFHLQHDENYEVYKYALYIVRSTWEEYNNFTKETIGKNINDIDIPTLDILEKI